MANAQECRRVLEYLGKHPERHDQGRWFDGPFYDGDGAAVELLEDDWECGTTACVAGWACLLNGWVPINALTSEVVKDGNWGTAPSVAKELLGLDDEQETELFYGLFDRDEAVSFLWVLVDGARP